MRAAAFSLIVALVAAVPAHAQLRRPADRRYVESPAAASYREGMRLLADEAWDDAARLFERAIELDAQYALAFYGLGRARMAQKQYVAAVGSLERCASLYLQHSAASASERMDRAHVRQDQVVELRETLRTLQSGPQTLSRQAAAERIAEMIRDLERDMHDGMTDLTIQVPAFVSLSLGSAHFRRGSMREAEREYRNALKANPKMGEAYNNLAIVLLLTGRPDDAEKSMKSAERHGFRVPEAVKDDIKRAKAAGTT